MRFLGDRKSSAGMTARPDANVNCVGTLDSWLGGEVFRSVPMYL